MPMVSINLTNKVLEVKDGEVLYDSLYDQGYELPHGCLSGSCGACRIEVIKGKDKLSTPSAIEQNTIEALKEEFQEKYGKEFIEGKEIRLSCRARVMGDVEIIPIK